MELRLLLPRPKSRWSSRHAGRFCAAALPGMILAVTWLGCTGDVKAKPVDFAHDVAPLVKKHCGTCHTNGTYKGSFSLDTREDLLKSEVIVPGKPAESELIRRLTSTDPKERMPLDAPPLSDADVTLLRNWVTEGAVWEPGFTFRVEQYAAPLRLQPVNLPPPRPGWEHPLDRLLERYWQSRGVPPPSVTDAAAFARRASLDLVGLLPVPSDLDRLTTADSAGAREAFVDQLLGMERVYADHWLAFWNDLLRNEYRGTGYIDGGRKQISQWLYQSLLDNKPYDQLVRELIDPVPGSEGFGQGIKWRGRINASQVTPLQFSQNVSQVFFGINMKCASCHDSFIDSWKLADAYRLAAVIAEEPLEVHRCDKPTGERATAGFFWPELGQIDPAANRQQRLQQLAKLVTLPENGRFARTIVNRLWQRLFGRGLVHPVDMMGTRPWDEEVLEYLAGYLVAEKYDLKKLLKHLATSRAYQAELVLQASETATGDYVFRGPHVKRMSAEQFLDAIWQVTGTGPSKADAPQKLPDYSGDVPAEWRFIRASLVHSNPLMRSLGRPNREQVVTARGDVLTTLQALDLSNGPEMSRLLTQGAKQLVERPEQRSTAETVAWLFRRAVGRPPTAEEAAVAAGLLGTPPSLTGMEDLLWAVTMLPEFQLIQ